MRDIKKSAIIILFAIFLTSLISVASADTNITDLEIITSGNITSSIGIFSEDIYIGGNRFYDIADLNYTAIQESLYNLISGNISLAFADINSAVNSNLSSAYSSANSNYSEIYGLISGNVTTIPDITTEIEGNKTLIYSVADSNYSNLTAWIVGLNYITSDVSDLVNYYTKTGINDIVSGNISLSFTDINSAVNSNLSLAYSSANSNYSEIYGLISGNSTAQDITTEMEGNKTLIYSVADSNYSNLTAWTIGLNYITSDVSDLINYYNQAGIYSMISGNISNVNTDINSIGTGNLSLAYSSANLNYSEIYGLITGNVTVIPDITQEIEGNKTLIYSTANSNYSEIYGLITGNSTAQDITTEIEGNKTLIFQTADLNYSEIYGLITGNLTSDGSFNSTSWNRSGTNVFLANTGDNVGIGLTNPSEKLQLTGNIYLNAQNPNISWDSNQLGLYTRSDAIPVVAILGATSYGSRFDMWNAGNAEKKVMISTDGDSYFNGGEIGIGTDSPVFALHINATTPYIRLENSSTGAEGNVYFSDENGLTLDTSSYDFPVRIGPIGTAGGIFVDTDGNSGYVGIGTTSPSAMLDVGGDIALSGDISQIGTANQLDINPYAQLRLGRLTNNTEFRVTMYKGDGSTTPNHQFEGTGNSYVSADNGYFGVGTNNPTHTLNVQGAVNITGNMTIGGCITGDGTEGAICFG